MSEWAASDSSPSEPLRTPTRALPPVRPADATIEDSATLCLTSCMRAFAPSCSYSFQLEPAAVSTASREKHKSSGYCVRDLAGRTVCPWRLAECTLGQRGPDGG